MVPTIGIEPTTY